MGQIRNFEGNVGKRDYYMVDPTTITIDPEYNVRDYAAPEYVGPDAILMESIRENGVTTPLECRWDGDKMILVKGHRRLRTVLALIKSGVEIKAVPVLPEAKAVSEEDRIADLIIGNSGEQLLPLEKAVVLARFVKLGWTDEQIAKKLGWKVQMVLDIKTLAGASIDMKDMVRKGDVSATTAVEATRRVGADKATELVKTVAKAKKAAAAKSAEEAAAKGKKAPKAKPDADRVSARDIKKATGDEGALSRKDIKKLVAALKWIAEHDETGKMAARANKALGDAGLLGTDLL